MSVLIKGMEMPKNCKECPFSDHEAWCLIPGDWRERYYCPDDERSECCPLIEVPTPHGRLIDADAHILKIRKQYCEDCSRRKGIKNGKMKFLYAIGGVVCRACEIEDMLNEIDDAPTVIEAEEKND